ncbi:MAG TPA: glycosyltransferase [Thermoanaerobaculia bacterium]|nr:glycosyltransferase [Thermoanaerobaculia bacterium]
MSELEVSIVLPCYRGAQLAHRSVAELAAWLPQRFTSWEILVVDDGGGDFGPEWQEEGVIRVIRLPRNRGKGAAVKAGMLAARGRVRLFTDIDLPYDLDLLAASAAYVRERGFHLVVGDRTLPGSSYGGVVGWRRRLASAAFSRFVGTFLTGGFFDTQCGLKAFRADVAEALFPLVRLERYAFDVEILYLALLHRLDIKRIPVVLRNHEVSTVRLGRDSLSMLLDVVRIRLQSSRGLYRSPRLEAIVAADFDAMRFPPAGGAPAR